MKEKELKLVYQNTKVGYNVVSPDGLQYVSDYFVTGVERDTIQSVSTETLAANAREIRNYDDAKLVADFMRWKINKITITELRTAILEEVYTGERTEEEV